MVERDQQASPGSKGRGARQGGTRLSPELLQHLQEREAKRFPLLVIVGVATLLLVAFLIGLATDFGRHVHPQFYVVVAQVLPLLLVASVVENALSFERWDSPVTVLVRGTLSLAGWAFLVGEGFALFAIASQKTSTFLLLTPVIVGALFVVDLISSPLERLGVSSRPVSTPARVEAMLERQIAKRRERAAELQSSADSLAEQLLDEADESEPGSSDIPRAPN